ncbi:MAG TPA: ABC transporter permease [Vicinamibacterales bacterium]
MKLADWLLRRRREDDLEDEIRTHLAMAATESVKDGLDAESARLAALKDFGNVTLTREATRTAWGGTWRWVVADLGQDVSYAVRTLARSPGYTAIVIAVLALGIGANVSLFSVFKSLVLTPIHGVENSGRLAVLGARTTAGRLSALPHPDFREIRKDAHAFEGLAGTTDVFFTVGIGTASQRMYGELVTGNYFQVLGVRAQLGRTLLPSDDVTPGNHPVVVISEAVWKRIFGSDPQIIGRPLTLNGQSFTVVGVSEPGFQGSVVSQTVGIFVPVMMQPQTMPPDRLSSRQVPLLWGLGRLRSGTTIEQAAAQADGLSAQLATVRPDDPNEFRATVIPIWQSPYGAQTYILPLLMPLGAMSLLLLFIVCANIANLVLVRGLSRRGEIAARLALGASRSRILRLLLVENIVVAIPGTLAGLVMSHALSGLMRQSATADATMIFDLNTSPDGFVAGFALLLSFGCSMLFGFVPALQSTRLDLATVMKDDLSARSGSKGRLRAALVVSQVAVSLVLLVGAGLVIRTLESVQGANPGFDARNVVLMAVDLRAGGHDEVRGGLFCESLLAAVRAEPGVEAAALASRLPLRAVEGRRRQVSVDGYGLKRGDELRFSVDTITSDYFRTLRTDVLAGRDFEASDEQSGSPVVIVNETMARRFWNTPDNAVGRRVALDGTSKWRTVIGVVRDMKYTRLNEEPRSYIYAPHGQLYEPNLILHVRSREASPATIQQLRRRVEAVDANVPILNVRMLEDVVRQGSAVYRMTASVLGLFGGIALLLAALGMYGLVSYSASRSAHEIGIRIAVGANPSDVARRFLGDGLRLGIWGVACGLAISIIVTRLLTSLLYGVGPTDVVSFASALAVVLVIVLAASSIPAWRAARTDPIAALRHR